MENSTPSSDIITKLREAMKELKNPNAPSSLRLMLEGTLIEEIPVLLDRLERAERCVEVLQKNFNPLLGRPSQEDYAARHRVLSAYEEATK